MLGWGASFLIRQKRDQHARQRGLGEQAGVKTLSPSPTQRAPGPPPAGVGPKGPQP